MKLLLIDVDGTLLDLSYFKESLFTSLADKLQIDKSKIITIYESVKLYDEWPQKFMTKLSRDFSFPINDMQLIFDECFNKIKLNKNVYNYLLNFDGKKYIFSFGGHDFQMRKIKLFNLDKCVDGIFITLENKFSFLKNLIHDSQLEINSKLYSEVILIDNKAEFLTSVMKDVPWIKVVNAKDII